MNCNCCFDDYLCKCIDGWITINTLIDPYKDYFFRLIDKFDNVYSGIAVANPDGSLKIPIAAFPDGLFTQWSGQFILQIFHDANGCEPVPLLLARSYDCISFSIKGGNQEKDVIGCELNAVAIH